MGNRRGHSKKLFKRRSRLDIVIWQKPVLTYAVNVVSLTASVNSMNSLVVTYLLFAPFPRYSLSKV